MPEKKSQNAGSVEGLQQTLDALAAQLAALTARLEKLEAAGLATPVAASAPVAESVAQPAVAEAAAAEPVKEADEFSEELMLVLSAAVAAYLGKRPHIRAVRLHGSSAWAQQGRVFVQASHVLNVPHEA
jgi:methylmalonyl-CoA carboxyltransferase large subunit